MSSTTHIASTKLERRTVIYFLMYENLWRTEIYRRIKNIYDESTINIQYVRKWCRKFKSGGKNIIHEYHSGRLFSVADEMLENQVDMIMSRHQKARLSDIVYRVNAAYGTVQNIVTKKTEISKKYVLTGYRTC